MIVIRPDSSIRIRWDEIIRFDDEYSSHCRISGSSQCNFIGIQNKLINQCHHKRINDLLESTMITSCQESSVWTQPFQNRTPFPQHSHCTSCILERHCWRTEYVRNSQSQDKHLTHQQTVLIWTSPWSIASLEEFLTELIVVVSSDT